ncbi:DUF998 domain-containing protein [Aeromicrobium sp.]|uniref:DUF998 domain-containing protein n=1 Tax=Aeromicrobium sp. TaxID=1871063 RepID=UPI003C6640A1
MLEVIVGLQASQDYRFATSTISDLGNTSCRTIRGEVLCSPWHGLMNVGFAYFGLSLALGALLLGRRILPGRAGSAAVALWCLSGVGSIGVSLVPVNEHGGLHGLVALPIFLAQPTALLMTGVSLWSTRRGLAAATCIAAVMSTAGVVGFVTILSVDAASGLGAFERLALWPGYAWVSVLALSTVAAHTRERLA